MSQKVKEIEGYIDESIRDAGKGALSFSFGHQYYELPKGKIKCTLLVPVEEKKITISESEFDEMVKEITCTNHVNSELLKQKLFSGNGGRDE